MATTLLVAAATPAIIEDSAPPRPSEQQQSVEAEQVDEAAAPDSDEIIVTGSRIRGAQPVGSNVIAIGARELQSDPAATVTDFLRKVPQIQGFGIDASSPTVVGGSAGTNTTRGSAINLRGLAPQATLTLIDGNRLSLSGVGSNYVDASAIPSIAIERVEVVADGASAIYGSDAIAGVVNFGLVKSYNGLDVRGRYSVGDQYDSSQIGVLGGLNWNGGGIVLGYEYSKRGNLNGGDREFIRSDLRPFGGNDFRNLQCNPGTLQVGTTTYAIPQGGVTPATANLLVPGTSNRCENLRFADVLPAEERHSGYGYIQHEITSGLKAHVQALYTDRDYLALAVQQGSTTNIVSLNVPSTNAFFVRPVGSTASNVTVLYDFTSELGLVRQTGYTRTLYVEGGFDLKLGGDWQASLGGLFTQDRSGQFTQRVNTAALTPALASSNPATAFNPFGGGNSQAVLQSIFSGVFNPFALSRTRGATLDLTGSLFQLPGGAVRVAVGGEYLRYTSEAGNRIGALAAPAVTINPKLARNQKSAFAEVYVPIFGANNRTGGLYSLELSAALRHDSYSDVGSTTNPKVGLTWSPARGLRLKGSYGTSFRAPGLQDLPFLRAGASLGVVTWTDPLSPTGTSTGVQLNAGNPNLQPETATTWTATAEFEPAAIPNLLLSASYFSVDYRGIVNFPPSSTTSLLNTAYAFAVVRNPSAALIQSYRDRGLAVNGVLPANVAFLWDGTPSNLGSIVTRGIDLRADYSADTNVGRFGMGANGSLLTKFDFQVTPAATPIDRVGFINYPVEFRGRGYLNWALDAVTVEAMVNYVGPYRNDLATPVQQVKSWTTVDLNVAFKAGPRAGILNGTSLGLSVTNLFDRDPPFANIQGGFDPGQASAVGRLMSISLSRTF